MYMKKFLLCLFAAFLILPVNGIVSATTDEEIIQETTNVEVEEETVVEEPTVEVPTVEETVEVPVIEETVEVEEVPVVEEETVVEETPVVEEETVVEETPVVEEETVVEETPVVEEETVSNTSETIYAKEIYASKGQRIDCSRFCTVLFRDQVEWHLTIDEAKTFTIDQMTTDANLRSYFVRECPGKPTPCVGMGEYPYQYKNPEMFDMINTGEIGYYEVRIGFEPGTVENFVDPSSPYVVNGDTYGTMKVYVHAPVVLPELPGIGYISGVEIAAIEEGTEISDEMLKVLFDIESNESENRVLNVSHNVTSTTTAGDYGVTFSLINTSTRSGENVEYTMDTTLQITDILPTIEYTESITVDLNSNIEDYLGLFNVNAYDSAIEDLTSDVTIDTSSVNTAVAGTYPVTLSVTDNEGNLVTYEAEVIVPELVVEEIVVVENVPTLTKTGGQAYFMQFILVMLALVISRKLLKEIK